MTPPAEHSTASEVNPSVRACSPSAIGRRADAAQPWMREGNPLVADESDQPGQGDPADMPDLLRVDQAGDGLQSAMMADIVIIATTNDPARSSTRPNP